MWLFTLRNPYKLTLYHRPANEQPMHTNTTIEPSSMYRKERFTIVFLERICDVIWGPPERICDVTWGPPVLSSRTSFISFNRSYDGRYKKKNFEHMGLGEYSTAYHHTQQHITNQKHHITPQVKLILVSAALSSWSPSYPPRSPSSHRPDLPSPVNYAFLAMVKW